MNASELAAELAKQPPDRRVLLKVGNDWVEVCGVRPTGAHRNAVTLEAVHPALGGVIVVEPDGE